MLSTTASVLLVVMTCATETSESLLVTLQLIRYTNLMLVVDVHVHTSIHSSG